MPETIGETSTNGAFATGDGIKMGRAIGAGMVDLEAVQVHPTGLIHPDDPKCKVRFLAAEALPPRLPQNFLLSQPAARPGSQPASMRFPGPDRPLLR